MSTGPRFDDHGYAAYLADRHEERQKKMYDSTTDTQEHITLVQARVQDVIVRLAERARIHDASKLEEPEKWLLDQLGSQKNLPTYGSPEERARFDALAEFRKHHYATNDHHPEHTDRGFQGMSLLSLAEMLCDWQAAGARHVGGDIWQSLKFNRERFGISDELFAILENTVRELGW